MAKVMASARQVAHPAVLDELAAIVGTAGLKVGDAVALLDRGVHPRNLGAGVAVLPRSVGEVAGVLAVCRRLGIPVVPQGGRTGLAGGATSGPGELIVMLDRLNRIERLEPQSGIAIVEAGVRLAALQAAAAEHGLSPGIDIPARDSASIGGMISTNAGGLAAFRQGVMRHRVLGLEAVLADGSTMSDLTAVLKANAGYDVKQLFIGAEGTLGIVTRAAIRLEPDLGPRTTALATVPTLAAALRLLGRLQATGAARLATFEVMSRNHVAINAAELKLEALGRLAGEGPFLLIELAATDTAAATAALEAELGAAIAAGEVDDAVIAKNANEVRDIWRLREEWGVDRRYPGGLWFDISVPLGRIEAYLAELGARLARHDATLRVFFIGHLADGNLHVTVNADRPLDEHYEAIAAILYDGLAAGGGSFSAEHGIGLDKRAALLKQSDPVKLDLMRRIKAAFDPTGIMNPGKLLDPGSA